MNRPLFNILAVISFVLFLALQTDMIYLRLRPRPPLPPPQPVIATQDKNGVWTFTYHSYAYSSVIRNVRVLGIRIPYLPASILTAAIPASWILLRMIASSSRHPTQRFCAVCGYDLRATPNRCPECGTVPTGSNP